MSTDYPGAIDMMLPTYYSFSSVAPLVIVCHQTGGDMTLDAVHNTFLQTMRSTHFAVDRDGNVAQFVPLSRGAGGNCCPDKDVNGNWTCNPFWFPYLRQYGNLNFCTISIEHCNNSDNNLPMTQAQVDASNKLIKWLCDKFQIDWTHIHSHASIDPQSKPFCPGPTFDFQQLFSYLKGAQPMITPAMQAEFDEEWDCVLAQPPYNSPARKGTGIYEAWVQAWLHGHNLGPPITQERSTNDFSGAPIVTQQFAGGRIDWKNNTPYLYTVNGPLNF